MTDHYKNRTSFQKGSRGAYVLSRKNNWLDEICNHMHKSGNMYHRCIYVFEFENNYAYVGLTFNFQQRVSGHLRKGKVYEFIQKFNYPHVVKQITDYVEIEKSQELEKFYLNEYIKNGWTVLNTQKTGNLGGNPIFWTKEKSIEEALKYNHRTEFRILGKGCYEYAKKHGWLDEVCSHMTKKPTSRTWSKEDEIFLLENYSKGVKFCSEKLNRTKASIKGKIKSLRER